MPICPVCGQKSQQLGVLCQCTKSYTIREGQDKDPLDMLGKQIANKIVPVSLTSQGKVVVTYEAWQTAVERMVTLLVLKTKNAQDESTRKRFLNSVNTFSLIHQQNLSMLFEEMDLTEEGSLALICDVRHGDSLTEYLKAARPDDVILVHIIHQILQGIASYHRYNICVPNIGYDNIIITQSGADRAFVKIVNVLDAILSTPKEQENAADDVWCVGQLALSLLTGQKIPITKVELSDERKYLLSIVQLFLKATAPIEDRYKNVSELLVEFETILDVHPKASPSTVLHSVVEDNRKQRQPQNKVEFDQIIWIHKPPHVETT